MESPLVSIQMVTYEQARYIENAIRSVLAQTYTNWKLIIMDDASTDDTEKIVAGLADKEPRIEYHRQRHNVYIMNNRNDGLNYAEGKYFAILDSDDEWTDPNKLEKQISLLQQDDSIQVLGTQAFTIDETGARTGTLELETSDANIRASILCRNQFVNSTTVMRLDMVKALGGYRTDVEVGEDYDLFLRLGLRGRLVNLMDRSTSYRMHTAGVTKQRRYAAARNQLRIIEEFGERYPNRVKATLKAHLRILRARLLRN